VTIEIRIENKDEKRTVRVTQIEYDKKEGRRLDGELSHIGPRDARTYHIHLLRDLRVEECDPS
jgi:hypothetical protein